MASPVQLTDVSVVYEKFPVLDSISLWLPPGRTTVVIGPSGCGKSTLLKTAAGLVVPNSGKVELLGSDLARISERDLRELRTRSGFVFQDGALWQNMNAWQNLALPLEYHNPEMAGKEVAQRIRSVLADLGYTSDTQLRPAQLSAGEQKIISFARALVADPEIIFVDEPTTSVDGETSERMIRKLKSMKERGKTVIVVTHDPEMASQLAEYIVVLKKGKLLAAGPVVDVIRSADSETRSILSDVLAEAATYDTDILSLLGGESDPFPGE